MGAPGGPACPVAVYQKNCSKKTCRRTVHNVPILRTLCTFLAVFVHNVPIFRTLCTLISPLGALFRFPAPLAVGESSYQGHRSVPVPLAAQKRRSPGQKRVLAPLATKRNSYQGLCESPAPLAAKKTSRQGRRGGSVPLGMSEDDCSRRWETRDVAPEASDGGGCFPRC